MCILILLISVVISAVADPAADQITSFKNSTSGPIGIMTTANGAPVNYNDTIALNARLIHNEVFMESMTNFVRERIPERVVHPKGAGAFGHFIVTHDVTKICGAKLFNKIGKKTPVLARFSPSTLSKGESDYTPDSRGFAVKFYTEDGNWDLVGFNTPMFFTNDPNIFAPTIRASRRNPVTNLKDPKMLWDLLTLRPETIFFIMYLNAYGNPDGFRHMPGFSIHTYQVCNEQGKLYFVRFHCIPDLGVKSLSLQEATSSNATDFDYAVRDLFNEIEKGNGPTWTISIQVLSYEDVKKADFDVFDPTKILPTKYYKLQPIGKLILNKNPSNFFADVEEPAFCPGNLVPFIVGAPDKLFEARRFSYRDAQLYRLGGNFNKIKVNRPLNNVYSYDRDGVAPVDNNSGGSPNYFPNSYHGPVPNMKKNCPEMINVKHDSSVNYDQALDMYNEMTEETRTNMITSIVAQLSQADQNVQEKAVDIFTEIHSDLGNRISTALSESANNN